MALGVTFGRACEASFMGVSLRHPLLLVVAAVYRVMSGRFVGKLVIVVFAFVVVMFSCICCCFLGLPSVFLHVLSFFRVRCFD